MLNNLLAGTIGIGEAALYALIGFLVVFGGIAFLIFIVWLIGKCMAYLKGEPLTSGAKKVETKKVETPKQPTQVAQTLAVADGEDLSEETVAVITAALMAYYQQAKPECGFIVKRIKRI